MKNRGQIRVVTVSPHVLQISIPTPTLPPSYETNSYIIHDADKALLVDAGTTDTKLLEQVVAELNTRGLTHLIGLVATHYHRDHTHGLPYMHTHTKAPIYIHPEDYKAARAELTTQGDADGNLTSLELVEMPTTFTVGTVHVTIEHAPGHTRGHVHILIESDGVILVGDHLAGDGSVWIGPPDGNMDLYYKALDRIVDSGCTIAGPGHGQVLTDAVDAAKTLKQRRLAREEQIYQCVQSKSCTVDDILQALYVGNIDPAAQWAARRTITAHLERLMGLHRIETSNEAGGPWFSATKQS